MSVIITTTVITVMRVAIPVFIRIVWYRPFYGSNIWSPPNVDSMVIKALIHNIQYTYIIIIVLLMSISFEL